MHFFYSFHGQRNKKVHLRDIGKNRQNNNHWSDILEGLVKLCSLCFPIHRSTHYLGFKNVKECNYAKRHSNIMEFNENHKTITPSIPARNHTDKDKYPYEHQLFLSMQATNFRMSSVGDVKATKKSFAPVFIAVCSKEGRLVWLCLGSKRSRDSGKRNKMMMKSKWAIISFAWF